MLIFQETFSPTLGPEGDKRQGGATGDQWKGGNGRSRKTPNKRASKKGLTRRSEGGTKGVGWGSGRDRDRVERRDRDPEEELERGKWGVRAVEVARYGGAGDREKGAGRGRETQIVIRVTKSGRGRGSGMGGGTKQARRARRACERYEARTRCVS
eukprot:1086718-Pleurochrysis_carterae.AAC.3